MREQEGLQALGKKTEYKSDYAPEVLETFINKHPENDYWVQFNCPEFTSLCPITGQPDFAEIKIMYIPGEKMVESKSLKLYLFSFRNHGDFHEDCVNVIMKDLVRLMGPKYIEVIGLFTPRGGISIYPYALLNSSTCAWSKKEVVPKTSWLGGRMSDYRNHSKRSALPLGLSKNSLRSDSFSCRFACLASRHKNRKRFR